MATSGVFYASYFSIHRTLAVVHRKNEQRVSPCSTFTSSNKNKEMNYKDKCSKGVADINYEYNRASSISVGGYRVVDMTWSIRSYIEPNAQLIAEAFNVLNDTGYTPRELADNFKTCLEHLENLVSAQYKGDAKLGKALVDSHTFAQQFKTK